jgi:hypothetical protein
MSVSLNALTDTWNASGTVWESILMNVTDTGHASGSKLLDLQINSTSVFNVDPVGTLNIPLGSITTNIAALNITATWNASGTTFDAPLLMNITNTASAANSILADIQQGGVSQLALFNRTASTASPTLALGNGTNPTGFQVFNTVDTLNNPTNHERGAFDWTTVSNTLTIGTQAGGTGTARLTKLVSGPNFLSIDPVDGFTWVTNSGGATVAALGVGGGVGFRFANNIQLGWTNTGANGSGSDVGLSRITTQILAVGSGAQGSTAGWLNYAGQTRVTADVNSTNTTTLATATGLSVALIAGRTYAFDVYLSFTCTAAQGIRAAMVATGGLTATAIEYDGWIVDSGANGIKGNAQSAALGTVVANAALTGTAGVVQIKGTITVNVAGTLNVQFAQSVAAANNTTVKRGSYMIINDMP